ncbi:sigma-70 family RNA polymerase sigma factor [Armatimonas rosea]|uniref:RNA polymerase sigma-B factor n=1 Tax=Armatimonas rosea TaxID=685828 RepID=A0A7W9W5Y9_ARMRO|nr:sigma-70 family RNA polymerase sigma factor [Armatimonas rosea]MBB6049455.1 RNA polymerase sigma-B factor [Armatimonas rosea]
MALLTDGTKPVAEATLHRWLQEYARRRGEGGGRSLGDLPLPVLREKIARAHGPLVESVARKFLGTGEPLEDLAQEGYLGLLSALEYYDPGKGVRFSTYATHFIGGAIRHFLRDRSRMIREPAWLQETAGRLERAIEQLTAQLEREPTSGEIAAVLAIPVETVEEIQASRGTFRVVSYDDSAGGDYDGILESIDDDDEPMAIHVENRIVLRQLIQRLRPFEQQVVYEFYFRNLNQTEIATKLSVSCNYVSVTLRKAVDRLGKLLGEAEAYDRRRQREHSIVDPYTGLYTYEHLVARLDEGISRAVRAGMPISVIQFQIQGIPSSGRAYDEAMEACGNRLRTSIRRMDMAGRGEGSTLLAVLGGTGPQVEVAARRLTSVLEDVGPQVHLPLRIVTGTAWHPEQGRTAQELLTEARRALDEERDHPRNLPKAA